MNEMKTAAVVVTYNRMGLLKEVLQSFDNQTSCPNYLIIVDNASNDGTADYLKKWKDSASHKFDIFIIRNEKNVGGSGGFYIGTKKAMEIGADWIWVSDDDAIPENNVFELAKIHIANLHEKEKVSAICARILVNGVTAQTNRNFRKKTLFRYKLIDVPEEYYLRESFEINCFSYLGVLMNAEKLKEVGLINKDYFIWLDDVEHSWRLNNVGKIICFPDMIVDHRINFQDYHKYSWKTYYGYRNDLLMLKEHATFYFYFVKIFIIAMKGILCRDKTLRGICFASISDALKGKTGMHSVYKPGWKK